MNKLPQHKAALLSDCGIRIRKMTGLHQEDEPIHYLHQDDYYVFGLVEKGTCRFLIDFEEQRIEAGEMIVVQPGQVHSYISSEQMAGTALIVDESYISPDYKRIFDEYALGTAPFPIDKPDRQELHQLLDILQKRLCEDDMRSISHSLAETCIGIVAEILRKKSCATPQASNRQKEIVMAFKSLSEKELSRHHQPAWYASQLNISAVYLNEVVRQVTHQNVSNYIRSQIMLHAKRLLAYSDITIKEIAYSLGFEDHAYFSRLFTQAVGTSPTAFRASAS